MWTRDKGGSRVRELAERSESSGAYPTIGPPLVGLERSIAATLVDDATGVRRTVGVVRLGLIGAELATLADDVAVGQRFTLTLADAGVTFPCEVHAVAEGHLRVEFGRMRPEASVWVTRLLASG